MAATMQAAQLEAVGRPLSVEEVPVPKPGKGEVLVRMAASPINPSDLGFLMGGYGFAEGLPVTPGLEGSGVVVEAGGGFMPKWLVGKRVACFARRGIGGAWAEYLVTSARLCVPIGGKTDLEAASMSLVNPLTALAFMDIVGDGKHTAFLNTSAAGALGRMLLRLGRKAGVAVVHVVRRAEQVEALRALGAEHVLDSSDPEFDEKLEALGRELEVRLYFDAVGGPLLGRLLLAAPTGSTIYSYGRLSDEQCVIEPGALILQNKTIDGFFLSDWMQRKSFVGVLHDLRRVRGLLSSDLATDVRERMPLERINEALELYQSSMSGGKILVIPSDAPGVG